MSNGQLYPTSPPSSQPIGRSILGLASVIYPEIDGSKFVPAAEFGLDAGTWTLTRDAEGIYGLVHTPAAETVHGIVNLNDILLGKIGTDPSASASGAEFWSGIADPSALPGGGQPHYFRGIQISGFDLIYKIGTLAITSGGVTAERVVFVNNVAPVESNPGGTISGTHAVATQTNPYVTPFTFATPYIIGNNAPDVTDLLEFTWVFQATSVFELYGINFYFNYTLL